MRLIIMGCIVTVVFGMLTAPCSAPAQTPTPAKVPRIGILTPASALPLVLEAFRQGLHDLGYVEGQTITLDYRFAGGRFDRLPELAAELVRLKVDVLVTDGSPAARAAKHATSTIPIVMAVSVDPVGDGLITSLARPGGNVTGLILHVPELTGKRLELLKEVVPGITRVAFLWYPTSSVASELALQEAEAATRALGVQLQPLRASDPDEFDRAFTAMTAEHADALLTMPSAIFWNHRTRLVDLVTKSRLPAVFPDRAFAEAGGLMSYGPSVSENFRGAATYVDKILKGVTPADLPVEQPRKFEFVINLKAAQALGLTLPPHLLVLADEVIR